GPVSQLLAKVVVETKYTDEWQGSLREDDVQRLANVDELLNAASQYDREAGDERSLEGFLEQTSLAAEVDSVAEDTGRTTLMTLHAAKGLEFPCVYVIAVEHGVLPHERATATHDPREMEEERRLLFVGMTRAMEQLTITHAQRRETRGRPLPAIPSEFLHEMTLEPADFTGGLTYSIDAAHDEESYSQEIEGQERRDENAEITLNETDPVPAPRPSPLVPHGVKLTTG